MSKTEMIETLAEQLNKVTAERDAWKKAAELNEQAAIENNGLFIDLLEAVLADLREHGRCNACKHYRAEDNSCHAGEACDTRTHWEWRGLK